MVVEFGKSAYTQISFASDKGAVIDVTVIDHRPQATEHYEGRRTVEVSIELFVELMDAVGYHPISPEEAQRLREKEITVEEEEIDE